jgi:hypothetical protein
MRCDFARFSLLALICSVMGLSHPEQSFAQSTPPKIPPANVQPQSKTNTTPMGADAVRENFQDLTARLLKLEIEVTKPKPKDQGDIRTGLIAGFAVLIAALVAAAATLLTQWLIAKREREHDITAAARQLEIARETAEQQLDLSRNQAIFAQTEKILEFRVKQLEYFYAPMFALLQQSEALYEKLCDQLVQDHPDRYTRLPQRDSEGHWIHVLGEHGTSKPFRLLDQMPAIKDNAGALVLVDEIIAIGKKTTNIISKRAGLATADLIDLLGEYLAHFAMLCAIRANPTTKPSEPLAKKLGYFPRSLNAKVADGYRELSRFLDEYVNASKKMLAEFPVKK